MDTIHTKKIKVATLAVFLLLPSLVFAAEAAAEAKRFVDKINDAILFPLIALMMAVSLLVFFYGAYEYLVGASNETARATGRKHLMYGVLGFFIMLSAFGILNIAAGTFGLSDELEAAREGETLEFSIEPVSR